MESKKAIKNQVKSGVLKNTFNPYWQRVEDG